MSQEKLEAMVAELELGALPDSVTLRKQAKAYLTFAAMLSKITVRIEMDDQVVAALAGIVANDDAWDAFYTVLSGIWGMIDQKAPEAADYTDYAQVIADKTGFGIGEIMLIIEMAIKLFQAWRDRRNPTPGPEVI